VDCEAEFEQTELKQIRVKAMDFLARREYSVFELKEKLTDRGFDSNTIRIVVDKLQAENLVNDERFCESLTRSRANRGFGPLRILRDLRQRGVDQAIIDAAVDAADGVWLERLKSVRDRKFGESAPENPKEWAKQARFLSGRGFSSEQISQLLNNRFDCDAYD